ncbi:MAG: DUF4469 domain-containing protein [Oscillatoriales cyanobacterium RM2_1_1]|nr:DUF4469 domain-containing protein [Oscillatoriales cyanobacterium SM2_3_0]NJO47428.1 DUF4469 domain-containing protein [Oscillatoriales cyanobacterium RM2_1_1]
MTIEYVLYENRLTADPDDYIAMVVPGKIVDLDDVADRMVQQDSPLTKADILSILKDFQAALFDLLTEGATINTPFANFSVNIKGTFNGIGDSYDSSRHQLIPVVNPGRELRSACRRDILTEKKAVSLHSPKPLEYVDSNTGEYNGIITPGDLGQINGHRLKFDPTSHQQGIFFIAETGETTRVNIIGQNKSSNLIFINPDTLTTGDYILEVRSLVDQTIHSGRLKAILSVA